MIQKSAVSRSIFWDLVRGIGILSIVMGHCCGPVVPYVYSYHLAIFFFISGYLFHEHKYGDDPFGFLAAKLKSSWPKYMIYAAIFILLHNFFIRLGINPSGTLPYSRTEALTALGNSVTFQCVEVMGGAMWFIPLWVLSCTLFCGISWFSRLPFFQKYLPSSAALWITSGLSILAGISGACFIFRRVWLSYVLHLVLLLQPFLAGGWLLRKLLPSFSSYLRWYAALACFLILILWIRLGDLHIDLSLGRIGNGWEFYLLAFLGIYCCLWAAKKLKKSRLAGGLFALLGRYSFDIMCLHFLVFKVLDLIYGRFFIGDPIEVYSAFPQAYGTSLWPFHAAAGVLLPAAGKYAIDRLIISRKSGNYGSSARDLFPG